MGPLRNPTGAYQHVYEALEENPTAKQDSEARRLLVGRLMIIAGIFVAGYFGINPPDYVAATVAFAFGLAAASFFPVILLGIFDKRANREGAVAGMIVGIVGTAIMGLAIGVFMLAIGFAAFG